MLAVTAGLVACGGEDEPAAEGTEAPAAEAEATDEVTILDFEFMPPAITVAPGTEVTFVNDDTAAHTASAEDSSVFDTGAIQQGDEATVTLKEPGTYPYICEFHPQMHGTVVVE